MLKWFRQGLSPFQTALAMVGAKSGDQVVVVGAGDPELAAQLALVTGLNGQTTVIGREEARPRVEAAAGHAGALIEFATAPPSALPVPPGTVDVLVLTGGLGSLVPEERLRALAEAMRVLRPGGRTVVIEGIAARPSSTHEPAGIDPEAVLALLTSAGGRAVRALATVSGHTYYEPRKPRDTEPG